MTKPPGERPPRVGMKMALRALLACVLVMVLTASALATTVLREVDDILEPLRLPGRADIDVPELDIPDPGGPRTFMVLGSDKREGVDASSPPRSDTILLARADPDKDAIAVMSLPRDLKVEIPGHGEGKINSAFELGGRRGGPRLVVRTVKKLFEDATGENFPITNVMVMDYEAFRRAVNYIDGVYVDIDRDYFNDNSSGENYATIDVDAGYQKLKGRDALDYVRYRHTDNDLVRAARQQDFLRQAKNAAGVRKLLALSESKHLIRVFSRYFRVDKSLRSNKQIFSMLKLVLYLSQQNPKVNEVRFRVHDAPNPQVDSNLYYRESDLRKSYREFMNAEGSAKPRESTSEPTEEDREFERVRKKRKRKPVEVAGLEDARREGEDQAVLADPEAQVPVLLPDGPRQRLLVLRHRAADLQDQGRARQEARGLSARAARPGHRRVLRRAGADVEGAADPRRPRSHRPARQPAPAALLRRQAAAARRLEGQARRLLGQQHADAVDRRGPDDRDRRHPEAAQAVV